MKLLPEIKQRFYDFMKVTTWILFTSGNSKNHKKKEGNQTPKNKNLAPPRDILSVCPLSKCLASKQECSKIMTHSAYIEMLKCLSVQRKV